MTPALLTPVPLTTGVTLAVWDSGPRHAPALFFLHGFPENHRTWRHQIAALSARFRCIAPDQRGYGASSKPAAKGAYAAPMLAADVFALADALGVERFTLVGHDWGAAVAWVAAIMGMGNRRVERLVIANGPHPTLFQRRLWTDPAQRAASQYIRLFRDASLDPRTRRSGLAPLLRRAFGATPFRDMEPEELDALARDWSDGETALAMLAWYRASPIVVPGPDEPLRLPASLPPPLPPLLLPTLVLWGEADSALPPANLEGLEAFAPDGQVHILPGVGHFSPWQAPREVTRPIDAFLGRTGA